MPQLLIWAGLVGGPLFVVVFLLEGATRTGYDPLRQPVSALALGPGGWMQQANFIVTGVLMLAFAVGLGTGLRAIGGSPLAPALIGLYAVGLIGAGVFVTGPVAGYPPAPAVRLRGDVQARLHDLFSLLVFAPLLTATVVVARLFAISGAPDWAAYSALTAVAFAAGFVLFAMGFGGVRALAPVAGLLQRATIVVGWGWLTLLALYLLGAIA